MHFLPSEPVFMTFQNNTILMDLLWLSILPKVLINLWIKCKRTKVIRSFMTSFHCRDYSSGWKGSKVNREAELMSLSLLLSHCEVCPPVLRCLDSWVYLQSSRCACTNPMHSDSTAHLVLTISESTTPPDL